MVEDRRDLCQLVVHPITVEAANVMQLVATIWPYVPAPDKLIRGLICCKIRAVDGRGVSGCMTFVLSKSKASA